MPSLSFTFLLAACLTQAVFSARAPLASFAEPSDRQLKLKLNLAGHVAYPVCNRRVAKRAFGYFTKCKTCIDAVSFKKATDGVDPIIDFKKFAPKCPPDCCIQMKLSGGMGHFIICYKGCCSRVASLQAVDTNDFEATKLILRTMSVVNNENKFLGRYGIGMCKLAKFKNKKCGPRCARSAVAAFSGPCDKRKTAWVPRFGTNIRYPPCASYLPKTARK